MNEAGARDASPLRHRTLLVIGIGVSAAILALRWWSIAHIRTWLPDYPHSMTLGVGSPPELMMRFHLMVPALIVIALVGLAIPALRADGSRRWKIVAAWVSAASLSAALVLAIWSAVWTGSVAAMVR